MTARCQDDWCCPSRSSGQPSGAAHRGLDLQVDGGLAAGKDEFSVGGRVFSLIGGAAAVGLADRNTPQGEGVVQLAALGGASCPRLGWLGRCGWLG